MHAQMTTDGWQHIFVNHSASAAGRWLVRAIAAGGAFELQRIVVLDPPPPARLRRILLNDTLTSLTVDGVTMTGIYVRHRATVAEAVGSTVGAAIVFGALAPTFCGTDENPSDNCAAPCDDADALSTKLTPGTR